MNYPKRIHRKSAGGVGKGWLVIDIDEGELIIGKYFAKKRNAVNYSRGNEPDNVGKVVSFPRDYFNMKYDDVLDSKS